MFDVAVPEMMPDAFELAFLDARLVSTIAGMPQAVPERSTNGLPTHAMWNQSSTWPDVPAPMPARNDSSHGRHRSALASASSPGIRAVPGPCRRAPVPCIPQGRRCLSCRRVTRHGVAKAQMLDAVWPGLIVSSWHSRAAM